MSRRRDFISSAVMRAGLHQEFAPCVPLVEICGQSRVLIENHQGVIGYSCNEILIKVRNGCVCIGGESLKLARMCKEKLVVTGRISSVNLQGRG